MTSKLRTQFWDYMPLQRFADETKRNYIRAVKGLSDFHQKPPSQLTNDEIQAYFLYLIEERKLAWGTCNIHFSAISCFVKNVLKWDDITFKCPPRPRIKQVPHVLSEEEVKRLFEATDNLKHKVLLMTTYSAGLRISEEISLRPEHIESDPYRMR